MSALPNQLSPIPRDGLDRSIAKLQAIALPSDLIAFLDSHRVYLELPSGGWISREEDSWLVGFKQSTQRQERGYSTLRDALEALQLQEDRK